MTEKELLQLKTKIDSVKSEISKLEGSQITLFSQLQKRWGCSSIEIAEKKLQSLKKKVSDLSIKIDSGLKEIEEKYLSNNE